MSELRSISDLRPLNGRYQLTISEIVDSEVVQDPAVRLEVIHAALRHVALQATLAEEILKSDQSRRYHIQTKLLEFEQPPTQYFVGFADFMALSQGFENHPSFRGRRVTIRNSAQGRAWNGAVRLLRSEGQGLEPPIYKGAFNNKDYLCDIAYMMNHVPEERLRMVHNLGDSSVAAWLTAYDTFGKILQQIAKD